MLVQYKRESAMLCMCSARERPPCCVSTIQERELHVVLLQYKRESSMLC